MSRAHAARLPRALALCAGLFALACASAKPPPAYATSNADDPKYPRSRFIVEYAKSTQSAEQAELQARAQIANDIQSEISAQSSSYLGQLNGKESQRDSLEVVQRTRFDRGDLIRLIDAAQAGPVFYARVGLERGHADAEFARAQSEELVDFTKYAELAIQASHDGKSGELGTASARAAKLIPSLDSQFVLRRSVLGHASDDERQFVTTRVALQKAMADFDTHRVVEIRIDGAPSPVLLQLAVAAVRKLGLRVGENQTCEQVTDHPAEATELVLFPEENCSEGSLGEKCEVAVRLHARGCQGGGEGEGRIALVRGIHPSDRDRARAAAWKRVTPDTVESAVGQALRQAQVIECSGQGC